MPLVGAAGPDQHNGAVNYQDLIDDAVDVARTSLGRGKVADYIPALACADRTEQFIAQFDVPKRLRDANVPRNEIGQIVAPIARELEHNGVVDRPLTEQEVLGLLEAVF